MDEDQNKLNSLRKSFVSDEAMAQRLRQLHPSFGSVDRTTIWRWCNKNFSRRARLALTILSTPIEEDSLRVSISSSVVNRTLLLACVAHGADMVKSPLEERGVKPILEFVTTGSESLKLLLEDKADVAIAGKDLLANFERVRRLCSIGSHALSGISSNCEISLPSDFKKVEFGFPCGTSIERILASLLKSRGCEHQHFGVASPDDGRKWLLAGPKVGAKGRCLVAYHEWFASAKKRIEPDDRVTFKVRSELFEEPERFDLYFNDKQLQPSSIRVLLDCLRDMSKKSRFQQVSFNAGDMSTRNLQCLKRFEDFHDAMDKDQVQFEISDLDAESILSLWDRDVRVHSENKSSK